MCQWLSVNLCTRSSGLIPGQGTCLSYRLNSQIKKIYIKLNTFNLISNCRGVFINLGNQALVRCMVFKYFLQNFRLYFYCLFVCLFILGKGRERERNMDMRKKHCWAASCMSHNWDWTDNLGILKCELKPWPFGAWVDAPTTVLHRPQGKIYLSYCMNHFICNCSNKWVHWDRHQTSVCWRLGRGMGSSYFMGMRFPSGVMKGFGTNRGDHCTTWYMCQMLFFTLKWLMFVEVKSLRKECCHNQSIKLRSCYTF